MAYTDQLPILKQKLLEPHPTDVDLKNAMSFYNQNIGKDPAFAGAAHTIPNDDIVVGNVKAFAGASPDIALFQLDAFQFICGFFSVLDQVGSVIYFSDVGIGLIGISTNAGAGPWKYRRFTASPSFAGDKPAGHAAFVRNFKKVNRDR